MEAAGRMGMSENEFELTTPRYFHYRCKGFEALQVESWQRARIGAFYAFLPHAKKNALRKPADLFTLPSDKRFEPTEAEPEIMRERLRWAKTLDIWGDKKAES